MTFTSAEVFLLIWAIGASFLAFYFYRENRITEGFFRWMSVMGHSPIELRLNLSSRTWLTGIYPCRYALRFFVRLFRGRRNAK